MNASLTTLSWWPQLKDIGSGNFGVAKLMRYKPTGELVAVKFIERGDKVRRNHREREAWALIMAYRM